MGWGPDPHARESKMRLITLKNGARPRRAAFLATCATVIALGLAGCADDDTVTGTPFTQALSKDYTDLSTQAAALPAPEDSGGFFSGLFGSSNPNDDLVSALDDKASTAKSGEEPVLEPSLPDQTSQDVRARLLRDIAAGKDQFPTQAAAAQGDYDCWILASAIPSAASMAQGCRSALATDLIALENAGHPAPPPMPVAPPPAPVAPPPPPPPAASTTDFTVYFDFDSWTLTAEDLKVITDVINSARAGGETHITIVGHTDTSGSVEYNQRLSVRRANVVVEALVDLGARRAAIKASGVGKTDLAVPTADGVKEAKNRRAVIDLTP
jgi:outer membrane protein OmpA-like peptidoglycan-associated protein